MKTSKDPRHLERIKVMQELFAYNFHESSKMQIKLAQDVVDNLTEIDKGIVKAAPTWPLDKINKIDLAILRLAVFELLIEKKAPPKVVVDEAVELAKEYGADSSASFVNGALGKVIEEHKITT